MDNKLINPNKCRELIISYNNLIKLLCNEIKLINIPNDTKIITMNSDIRRRGLSLLITNSKFQEIDEGIKPPIIIGEFETIKNSNSKLRKLTFD